MNSYFGQPSRRTAAALLLSGVMWTWKSKSLHLSLTQRDHATGLHCALLSLFDDPQRVIAIGAASLKSLPSKRHHTPISLARSAIGSAGIDIHMMDSRDSLRRLLVTRMRSDFAEGKVLNIEGWVLSQTEAHLYALVALSSLA